MRLRNLHRARIPTLGPLIMATLSVGAIVALLAVLGPIKAVVVGLGFIVAILMLRWPVIAVILVVFTGTCFQVIGSAVVVGLPLSFGKIAGLLGMTVWIVTFSLNRIPWTYTSQLKAMLGYVGAMLVVAIFVHPAQPSDENGFFRFFQAFVVFWLVANLAGTSRTALITSVGSLTAAMVGTGIIGALEFFVPSFGLEHFEVTQQEGLIGARLDHDSLEGITLRRITGGMGDSNWLAATVAAAMPLNLFWLSRVRGNFARMLILGSAGIQMLVLVMSYARLGFLSLAVSIFYLVVRRVISARLLVWGAVAAVLVSLIWLPPGFVDRFFSSKYLEEGSTPIRKDLAGTALRLSLERPLLGHGFGQFGAEFVARVKTDLSNRVSIWSFEIVREAEEGREPVHNIGTHNMYLEITVEYGLLGLVPFVMFLALILADLRCCERWGNKEDRLLAICLAAGVLGFYFSAMLLHAKYLKILWIMAGLAAAHRRVVLTEHQEKDQARGAGVPHRQPSPDELSGRLDSAPRSG